MTDQEQTERGAMPKMIDSDGYDRSTGDAIAGHIVAKMYRQDSDGHEQCRADLERVTAELEAAEKMIEVAQKAIAHYIEQIEAERDAMREVCDLAPDALVILAGLHLGTTWELSPYVKDELARVTPLVRDALARLDATRKAADDVTEEGK
jgi:hypothetical protein